MKFFRGSRNKMGDFHVFVNKLFMLDFLSYFLHF